MARAAWPSRAPPRAPARSPGVARRPPRPTPAAHVFVPSRFLHRRALSSRRRADRLVLASSTGGGAGSGSGGAGGGGGGRGGRPGGGGDDADDDADDDDDDGDDDARGRGGRGGRSRPPRAPSFALAGAAAGRASPDAADARAEEEEAASATLRASDSSPRSPPRISVSIVIPALNEELAIGRVLRNLECLDPPPLEVIVAVGDSQDATEALAKRFAEDRKRLRRVRKGLLEEETVTETATERRPGRDAARRRGRFWSSRSPNPKNPDPGEKKTTTPPSGLEPASSGSEPPSLTNTNTNVTSPPPPPSCRHAWDVRTVRSRRGRASQMNAGAALARGDALLFLHADTFVPDDVVALVAGSLTPFEQPSNDLRTTIERPPSGPTNGEEERTVVAGGFASLIEHDRRTFWGMSAHNVAKTFYAPLLFRPLSFARGLRVLFGDQAMFVRAEEFRRVGGFDEALPIMEDADLCVRLHDAGPARKTARRTEGRRDEKGLECDGKWRYHTFREGAGGVVSPGGSASDEWRRRDDRSTRPFKPRVKPVGLHGRGSIVLVDRAVRTSGRRVDALGGNLKATAVHFLIGLSWYFGATPEDMVSLYRRFYEDVR